MNYKYNIAGLKIKVICEEKFKEEASIFSSEFEKEDILVNVQVVEEITEPNEMQSFRNESEYPVWRNENMVLRDTWDLFREKTHMRIEYDLNNPSVIQCFIRKEDWFFATTEKYFWEGVMLQYMMIHNTGLILHSSYVEYNEQGVLFIGKSGVGKSTQADLWKAHRNARILNGDKAGIRIIDGCAFACGVPFSGTSGICVNRNLPLKAIVVLAQAPENSIKRLTGIKAVMDIYPHVFVGRDIPEESQMALENIFGILNCVPVYELACTPDVRAVETLEEVLG